MATEVLHPLPYAPELKAWSWLERSDIGHDACDVVFRVPADPGEGPILPGPLQRALPLLLHEFERGEVAEVLERINQEEGWPTSPGPQATLGRIVPTLRTFRYVESEHSREFVFVGARPTSLHVLSRVLDSDFRFRLEDLSHFATHGELMLKVLHAVGLKEALDPGSIIYAPALDSPFPFKFFVVGKGARNRVAYVNVLVRLMQRTESDETFRARHFRELIRGFQKFGPAAATPQFQEVELRLWRLLSYTAARLRVKAGRLSTCEDPAQVRQFLGELRQVHFALDQLEHLPGRLAAFYRTHFDIEFGTLYEHALRELDEVARLLDCDVNERERNIDAIAALVSGFRRLGSTSPLESLEAKDREIRVAYGEKDAAPLETGWARTYTEAIFTGAARFDTRRFGAAEEGEMSESDLDLELDLDFGPKPAPARPAPAPAGGETPAGSGASALESSANLADSSMADLVEGSWGLDDSGDEGAGAPAGYQDLWDQANEQLRSEPLDSDSDDFADDDLPEEDEDDDLPDEDEDDDLPDEDEDEDDDSDEGY